MLYTADDIKNIRMEMCSEYQRIGIEIMTTKNKLDPDSWTYKELGRAVDDLGNVYGDLDVIAMLIQIIHEMDTEHDIFVVQKELNDRKARFARTEEFNMRMWELPRDVFGAKEPCQRKIEAQLIEFVKNVKKVLFEDVMGE